MNGNASVSQYIYWQYIGLGIDLLWQRQSVRA